MQKYYGRGGEEAAGKENEKLRGEKRENKKARGERKKDQIESKTG